MKQYLISRYRWLTLVIASAVASISAPAVADSQIPDAHLWPSATLAREINGFKLGEDIREIAKRVTLEHLVGPQFDAHSEGINYNFEVSPLGRVYRISSEQNVGHFQPDREFYAHLRAMLIAKYGNPQIDQPGNYLWGISQPVTNDQGVRVTMQINGLSVSVIASNDGVVINMALIDFRYNWIDNARINSIPKQTGENRIRF